MNRTLHTLLLATGLLTVLMVVPGCSDDDGEAVESDDVTTTTAADSTDTTVSAETGTDVAIAEYAFAPESLTVGVGDTVTWTNGDDFAHASAGDADEWESGDIEPGATFERTFTEAGTFPYHCSIHNFMTGEIVVEG